MWPYLPIVAGTLATFFFFLQGGFGGGHGRFDGLIVVLMLPAIALLEVVPMPEAIVRFEYIFLIAIPTLINVGVLCLIDHLTTFRPKHKGES
jgi:hypothetical protein